MIKEQKKKDHYWIVDIGGTKILLVVIDSSGRVLFRKKTETPKPSEPDAVVDEVCSIIKSVNLECNIPELDKPSQVGVCMAGFVDHESGLVYLAPNLKWLKPVPLGEILAEKLSCPTLVENDANAAVVGEAIFGSARDHDHVIYITISTGIGSGLFLDGRLYRGSGGFSGEIGHLKPYGKGRTCKCGGADCLETWASGTAITDSAKSLWGDDEVEEGPITTEWVFKQADAGNELAQKIIDQAADTAGTGLSNLVNVLNPSCIVIGGGVASNRPDYLDRVSSRMIRDAAGPSVDISSVKVLPSQLEPEAGIWGMYALLTGQAV